MYQVIKRKKLLLLFGGVFLIALLCLTAIPLAQTISVFGKAGEVKPVVIVDAGHGGVDPGAIGKNGVNEKEVNLAIALDLRDILIVNGYEVVMIREEDTAINDPQYKKISQVKTSDLKKRLKIIESYPDAITVSIHQNKFGQEQYHGAQMFYGRHNEKSKLLAEILQNTFREDLQPDNTRAIKRSTSDVYILHNAKNPIVLVECGFLSNWQDCENLCNEEYQQKVAFTIFKGISVYQEGSTG